jgi:hypothetical protein
MSSRVGRILGGVAGAVLLSGLSVEAGQAGASAPTFSKDVAPIIFNSCTSCHRPGEMAPMPLTSYKDIRPWVRAIRLAVESRAMPPWGADPSIGEFSNDPRLSASQVDTILRWADTGAVEGNPADLPALPRFAGGWQMGKPDAVFTMQAFDIPPSTRSVQEDFLIPTSFGEDKFVRSAEVRPAARGVTHHANVYVREDGNSERVASYSPGAGGKSYPPGVAKLIPKGTTLTLNMHYNPKGRPGHDPGTTIGLQFAKEPIRQVAITAQSGNGQLDIPPGEANYELIGRPFVFEEDSHLLTLTPRMNERGKDFRYTLVYPDGTSRVLLFVPRFNHGWVFTYALKEPIAAPKGSRIETIAHWDNSAHNKFNPDPAARIRFGLEIMNGYFEYTLDGQDLLRSAALTASSPRSLP